MRPMRLMTPLHVTWPRRASFCRTKRDRRRRSYGCLREHNFSIKEFLSIWKQWNRHRPRLKGVRLIRRQMQPGESPSVTGGAIVFFTYIGFDSVSTAAEECKNPKRDLPIGILVSLVCLLLLLCCGRLDLSGIQRWNTLGNAAPVAQALEPSD